MLSEFIKEQRKRRDVTQQEAAAMLNVSRATYIRLEGEPDRMSLAQLRLLADKLDMPVESLINESSPENEVVIEGESPVRDATPGLSIRVQREDIEKFKQVILYILCEVGGKPNIGETVMHKLLYFIDFDYYEKYEENLTGVQYIKNHHGPTAVAFARVIREMMDDGLVAKGTAGYHGYEQKRYQALKSPALDLLSGAEVKHIDDVLARLSDMNAKQIEEHSHQDVPWLISDDRQAIPYESVFYRDDKYSVRDYSDDEL